MKILIKNAHCIDPRVDLNDVRDVFIDEGCVSEVGKQLNRKADIAFDAKGLYLLPGLIDVHVHFREPGFEVKETIETGVAAAINGGITACVTMPNTNPVCDSKSVVDFILKEAARLNYSIFPCGTLTKDRAGKDLAEMADMKRAGIVAVSDDGSGVQSSLVMRNAMEYASMLKLPVLSHAEDEALSNGGVMHEGPVSTRLGLPGIPDMSEYIMVLRDIELARLTGAHLHIQHVSCKESMRAIAQAKSEGVSVTCEVTPHHLMFTDRDLEGYDPSFKMNPPLGDTGDRDALREAVMTGVADMIATDHAPHHSVEKERGMNDAPCGCIGLETSLGVVLTELVHTRIITIEKVVDLMNIHPAKLIGKPDYGAIKAGEEANLTLVDVDHEWTVDSNSFRSKARNCPFDGAVLKGRAVKTIVKGQLYHNI